MECELKKGVGDDVKDDSRAGRAEWLKWWNTCLASEDPEFKPQYSQKKKKKRDESNVFWFIHFCSYFDFCILFSLVLFYCSVSKLLTCTFNGIILNLSSL
jgi:hypothetical protein